MVSMRSFASPFGFPVPGALHADMAVSVYEGGRDDRELADELPAALRGHSLDGASLEQDVRVLHDLLASVQRLRENRLQRRLLVRKCVASASIANHGYLTKVEHIEYKPCMDAVSVDVVESARTAQGREFIELPHRLYKGCRQWVPQFRLDMRAILDRRHPFFDRSEAAFFICRRGGRTAGTIGALNNVPYNEHHGSARGHFHFFECAEDPAASHALFEAAFAWMRQRGLREVVGPYGFGVMGMGILVDGFEHRAAMTMMAYNHPYYQKLLEAEGFRKHKDQLSMFLDAKAFRLPDKIRRVAEIAMKRGSFEVPDFKSKSTLRRYAGDIGKVYNESFQSHGDEYNPLSAREIEQVTKELLQVADPSLIKLLLSRGEIAGFLFGFPDLSEAIQRSRGRLTPFPSSGSSWNTAARSGSWSTGRDPPPLPEARRQRPAVLHAGENRLPAELPVRGRRSDRGDHRAHAGGSRDTWRQGLQDAPGVPRNIGDKG